MAFRSVGGIPESITRTYMGGYYFPEGNPFAWDEIWNWIVPDIFGIGSLPQEQLPSPIRVPIAIGEIPQTWEELEETSPELFEPILETRPGRTPDAYPQTVALPPPEQLPAQPDDEEPMAHDWGHLIRQGIGSLTGISDPNPTTFLPSVGGAAPFVTDVALGGATAVAAGGDCDGMAWSGGTPPKGYKVVNYCGKGVLRKVRRRRKPRMLTRSDSQDVATIIGLVGKGQLASVLMNRR